MRHAHSGTRLIVGEGRGGRLGVSAVPCWRVSASLPSVHVCHSLEPPDSQDGKVTEKLRPKEDSDACISCPCLTHGVLEDRTAELIFSER